MGDRVPEVRMTECDSADSAAKATAGLRHHRASLTTSGGCTSASLHRKVELHD